MAMLCAAVLVGAVAAAPAGATNGMEMIGYNPRAVGMGGADIAVDSDAQAVSCNPAVICGQAPNSATVGATVLMPHLNLQDGGGNDVDGEQQYFAMPLLGYVHTLATVPLTLGLGVYAQGGMGVDFKDVNTGMGTQDRLMSEVAFLRLNPIVTYKPADWISVGATVMVGYAQMKFDFFPQTSSAGRDGQPNTGDDFAGMSVRDLHSFGFAGKVGTQVKISPTVRFGAAYTSETAIDLDNGDATLNFGGNKVKYDAKMDDFTWPQELEFGVAYLPVPGLTIAADAKWINWSDAIKTPVLKISDPNAAGAPQQIAVPFVMEWDDQWVFAIGAEYVINPKHTVRAGFNYGKNPVPDETLNPLFPAIMEKHLTFGYGLNLGKWIVDLAYEHAFENTATNPVTTQEVSHSQDTVSVAATYRY
jgi:long-chain fatty acid transport protein